MVRELKPIQTILSGGTRELACGTGRKVESTGRANNSSPCAYVEFVVGSALNATSTAHEPPGFKSLKLPWRSKTAKTKEDE